MSESQYAGGSAGPFSFSFESYQASDVKVSVDAVDKTVNTHYTISNYTTTGGGQVTFTTGNVPTGAQLIRIYRQTDLAAIKATFAAGSSIKSEDLNNNFKQLRLASGEIVGPNQLSDGLVTSAKILNGTIVDADIASNAELSVSKLQDGSAHQLLQTSANGNDVEWASNIDIPGTLDVTGATTLDSGVSVNGNITVSGTGNITVSGTVDGRDVSADGTKLDTIESGATADQTNDEIRAAVDAATNSNVFTDADHTKLNAIEAGATADQTATEIKSLYESNANTNVFDDSEKAKLLAIESGATADQTAAEIRSLVGNANDSNVYTDAHYNLVNGITATSAEINKLDGVTASTSELNVTDGITATTSEINILDGVTSNASELNTLDGITASTADLNQLVGKTISSTFTPANSNDIPTSAAINTYVSGLLNSLGGFVAIPNENSFPTTNPDPSDNAGTIVSIANAGGMSINGSGVGTGQTTAGTAVTITGFPSTFNGTTIQDGLGLQVQTTSTLNTYTYHKVYAKDDDVRQLSQDVNDFKARYRVGASNPTTDLDPGDLFFNTGSGKMLVYNGQNTAWEEVQSIGEFFINTLSASSSTGGGSATFNGTAYRFTLSNAPTNAEQLLVSVNGVVQKPNSGTSQPSEGFALDGSDIIFSAAPATNSPFFVITIGSSVNIGTPSAGTVGTAQLATSAVTNAKISSSAAIASSKLAKPIDFADNEKARFGTGNDLQIYHDGSTNIVDGQFHPIELRHQSEVHIKCVDDGAVELYHNNSKKLDTKSDGIDVTGEVQCDSLDVDGLSQFSDRVTVDRSTGTQSCFSARQSGTENALIKADGSATFASTVTANGGVSAIKSSYGEVHTGTNTVDAIQVSNGSSYTAQIKWDGSATFNGHLGIGTTTPPRPLTNADDVTLTTGNAPQYRLNGGAGDNNDNDRAIFGLATASGHFFSGSAANDAVLRSPNGGNILFGSGTNERMRLLSGGGLTFNGDTAAANALDDYEEGVFTPVLLANGTVFSGITYTAQNGYYVKVGKLVYTSMWVTWSSRTNTSSNTAAISLPFTSNNASGYRGAIHVSTENCTYADYGFDSTSTRNIGAMAGTHLNSNVAYTELSFTGKNGGGWGSAGIRVNGLGANGGNMQLSGTYMAQ